MHRSNVRMCVLKNFLKNDPEAMLTGVWRVVESDEKSGERQELHAVDPGTSVECRLWVSLQLW